MLQDKLKAAKENTKATVSSMEPFVSSIIRHRAKDQCSTLGVEPLRG